MNINVRLKRARKVISHNNVAKMRKESDGTLILSFVEGADVIYPAFVWKTVEQVD